MNSIAIIEAVNTTSLPFHGQHIITAMAAGVVYVAMKPIVENLGLSWTTQHRKLMEDMNKSNHPHMSMVDHERGTHMNTPSKFNCILMNMVAGDSKLRQFLCIPLKKLNGWLFSINPEKVRADIRDKLIQYQEECFTALHDYWTKGQAINPRKTSTDERTPLRDAVNLLVGKKGIMYPEAYSYVHQRFNVSRIEDLDASQIPAAIEYVHRLALEGDLLPKEEKSTCSFDFWMYAKNAYAACQLLDQMNEIFRRDLEPALRAIESPVAGRIIGRLIDSRAILHGIRGALDKMVSPKDEEREINYLKHSK